MHVSAWQYANNNHAEGGWRKAAEPHPTCFYNCRFANVFCVYGQSELRLIPPQPCLERPQFFSFFPYKPSRDEDASGT